MSVLSWLGSKAPPVEGEREAAEETVRQTRHGLPDGRSVYETENTVPIYVKVTPDHARRFKALAHAEGVRYNALLMALIEHYEAQRR